MVRTFHAGTGCLTSRADSWYHTAMANHDDRVSEPGADEDFELCNECGGLCCALYLAHDEHGEYVGEGWLPEYIDLWIGRFIASGALGESAGDYGAGVAGVEPLHDPRMSHLPSPEGEAYRSSLPAWVDTRKCQFCHPQSGCMLPRQFRAPICGEYVCELWEAKHGSTLDDARIMD